MKIEEKKTEKENEKMNRLEGFNRKKNGVMKLVQKKEEMEVELDLVKRYLIKYRRDVRQKERRAIVELVLSSDEEVHKEKKKKPKVSIVSNSLKLSLTFSNILKTSYVYVHISLINICCFFIQHSDEKMAQQKGGNDGYRKKPITKVSIVSNTIKHLQKFLNILKYIIYVTLIIFFLFYRTVMMKQLMNMKMDGGEKRQKKLKLVVRKFF